MSLLFLVSEIVIYVEAYNFTTLDKTLFFSFILDEFWETTKAPSSSLSESLFHNNFLALITSESSFIPYFYSTIKDGI